ncbi:MAG TPA: transcriptional regulator, partial [Casimicrobiaceae bacterium]
MRRDSENATESADVTPSELSDADTRFLDDLGAHVRNLRERRGMSRKLVARESRVSERYLAK